MGVPFNKKGIGFWLMHTAAAMYESDEAGCTSFMLGDIDNKWYSLSVGWMPGYDENEKDDGNYRSRKEPTYALNAAIVKYNPSDCCDLEFMDQPYDEETGEVYDTMVTLGPNEDWESLAQWFIDNYNEIKKFEILKGEK